MRMKARCARVGLIDDAPYEVCSRLDAILYARHRRLVNGYTPASAPGTAIDPGKV
jgi:hypothetical protein